jgi:hypothetical protein
MDILTSAPTPPQQRERFRNDDAERSLTDFAKAGEVYGRKWGVLKKPLTGPQAADRLEGDYDSHGKPVFVKLPNGKTHKIEDFEELQDLDTFQGQGLKPSDSPAVVDAFKSFDKGLDANDGLFRDGYAFTGEKRLDGYEAYRALTLPSTGLGKAALKGAGVGAAIGLGAGLLAAGASLLFPGAVPLSTLPSFLLAGGAGLAGGATLGAGSSLVEFKNAHPGEVEVRHGEDFGLKLRTPAHAVETHQWLEERAANPFTGEQQKRALDYLSQKSGLYDGRKKLDSAEALDRLQHGKSVQVPSNIPNHRDELTSARALQQLDTVRGLGVNPVLPKEISTSLGVLETGPGESDGLYRKGRSGQARDRLSAFEAVDYLFREREPIAARVHDKDYQTKALKNIQELNALKGDGKNTILPDGPFQSLQFFDGRGLLSTEARPPVKVDSYEALQEMNEGRAVRVPSQGREARSLEPADLHELRSLEFDRANSILPQRDFDVLTYWDGHGGYRVENETRDRYAYEALQSLQAEKEFEVQSAGRFAPALTFQDLEDLASFEAPQAGFTNNVPPQDQDRLTYFQSANEEQGQSPVNVAGREGRAYEGYRQLRDGHPFDVRAGGVWNSVTSSQALHDLDALLGRGVNDILPQDQYDLLKELADGSPSEGLARGGVKLNSYASLQELRADRDISYDFTAGDFGEVLSIPTDSLQTLANTKQLRDNQKEYDRYAYPVPEWKDKMNRQFADTPRYAQDNLAFGERNLRDAESDLRRAQSDLSDAESDLRRAKSDLSYAESELSRARSLPTYITKYRQVCDSNHHCHQESYQEFNYERQRAVSAAESKVSRAESDIRRAKSDIDEAEQKISRARRDIEVAEGQISDARRVLELLQVFGDALAGANDSNYAEVSARLQTCLDEMAPLSHIAELDTNLRHQTQLISNMATRPPRPQGWVAPSPLVQF